MLGFGDSSGRKRQQQIAELAGEIGEFREKLSPLSLRCPNWHVSNMVQTASSVHVVPGYLRHAHDDCRGSSKTTRTTCWKEERSKCIKIRNSVNTCATLSQERKHPASDQERQAV